MDFKKLRPYGIVVAVVAVIAVAALVLSPSDDDKTSVDTGAPTDKAVGDWDGKTDGGPDSGIGTDAALNNPDCDKESGRLAISFVYRPPCVAPFAEGADNGGATATGVTADTIKVIYYSGQATGAADDMLRQFQTSIDLYEHFYEMWGRKIELSTFAPTGADEVAIRADAISMANEKPFAVIGVTGIGNVMQTELASRGVIALTINPQVEMTQQLAPYLWGIGQNGDQAIQLNSADYVGKRLLGHPAQWAGDKAFTTTERKFGMVYPSSWDLKTFNEEFAKVGGTLAEAISYESGNQASFAERSRVIAARMKEAGVTSVIVATDFSFTSALTAAATGQKYFPEWVTTGYGAQDVAVFARNFDDDQWPHAFGVGTLSMGGVAKNESTPLPEIWFYLWYHGNTDDLQGDFNVYMTTLFTGIHGAGPKLTPSTFRDGVFALPASGGAATGGVMSGQLSYGRAAGFPWIDYNGYDDFNEIYWDATATGIDVRSGLEATGHYRELNEGKRSTLGSWPSGEPTFFDAAGTAIREDSYPPDDQPPDFPCNDCPSNG